MENREGGEEGGGRGAVRPADDDDMYRRGRSRDEGRDGQPCTHACPFTACATAVLLPRYWVEVKGCLPRT